MKGTLHSLADCQNGGLRACLAPFVKATLTSKDIVGLRNARCFRGGAAAVKQAGDCLPLRAGADERTGKTLAFHFVCTDVCPNQGRVAISYEDVDEKACCALGGEPNKEWLEEYTGCSPPEYVAKTGLLHATPEGKWLHIRTSNCPGGKPTIYGEWPCEPANLPMLGIVRGPLPKDVQRATTARVYTPSDCVMRPRGSASR